jgi:hypothetical protein
VNLPSHRLPVGTVLAGHLDRRLFPHLGGEANRYGVVTLTITREVRAAYVRAGIARLYAALLHFVVGVVSCRSLVGHR